TAFYTPPVVISSMYQALENMGLKSGNILEPSCGIGNFSGRRPESLSGCRGYGVEIDSRRTLPRASLGSLMPLRTRRVLENGGIYCGIESVKFSVSMGKILL